MSATAKVRVRKVRKALKEYIDANDHQSPVVDMLADLRHWCDRKKLDFGECDRIAHDHYLTERGRK